jgi:hypothetical protein
MSIGRVTGCVGTLPAVVGKPVIFAGVQPSGDWQMSSGSRRIKSVLENYSSTGTMRLSMM